MKFIFRIDSAIFISKIYRKGKCKIIDVNKDLIKIINGLYNSGLHEIIFCTSRSWSELSITKKQLKKYNIKYNLLVMGEPEADYIIDKNALRPEEFFNIIEMENTVKNYKYEWQ